MVRVLAVGLALALGVGLAVVLPGAVSVQAQHVHTVNGVYHGLGDYDDDYHVHAFNQRQGHGRRVGTVSLGYKGRGYFIRVRSKRQHLHIDWDTSNRRECIFFSFHWVKQKLNGNAHAHHNDCR
jgi:hypothetical protein